MEFTYLKARSKDVKWGLKVHSFRESSGWFPYIGFVPSTFHSEGEHANQYTTIASASEENFLSKTKYTKKMIKKIPEWKLSTLLRQTRHKIQIS